MPDDAPVTSATFSRYSKRTGSLPAPDARRSDHISPASDMGTRARRGPPGPSDPETGVWQGRSVARRFVSPDGLTVLVGRTAEDNDLLTFRLASPRDFWLHVAGESGSHVVVRNPENLDRLPRETAHFAAALAAGYSRASAGGKVSVHLARC